LIDSHRVGLVETEDLTPAKFDGSVRVSDFVTVELNATLRDQSTNLRS
jgi:hypothetical protein